MTWYSLRAVRWAPFIAMGSLAVGYLAAHSSTRDDPAAAVESMRVVTLLLALGGCAAFDDPAAATLAASPTALRRRRGWQGVVALAPAALLWLIALATTMRGSGASAATAGLVLEAATLAAFVLAAALVAQRLGWLEPGPVAGALTIAAALALIGLPHRAGLLVPFADPNWHAVHRRWEGLLAALVVVAALASRDPAGRALAHRR